MIHPSVVFSMLKPQFATSAASSIMSPSVKGPEIIEGDFRVVPKPERTKFIHLRYHFEELKHATNQEGISNRGGATLAYKRSSDLRTFTFSFALCNMKENFSRFIGRQVSHGYLQDDICHVFDCEPQEPDSKFIELALTRLVNRAKAKWEENHDALAVSRFIKGLY